MHMVNTGINIIARSKERDNSNINTNRDCVYCGLSRKRRESPAFHQNVGNVEDLGIIKSNASKGYQYRKMQCLTFEL